MKWNTARKTLVYFKSLLIWNILRFNTIKCINGKLDEFRCLLSICYVVVNSFLTFFLRRGVQVSCSKKHCHSNDFSQRQCQRLSMTLPIDKSWAGLGVCNWRPDFWSDKFWLWSEEASFVCSEGFPESTSGGYKTWYLLGWKFSECILI